MKHEIKSKPRTELILDSGAYTAWSKGQQIDLKEYIKYLKDNLDSIDYFFNLDVIAGRKGGKAPSQKETEAAAEASFINYQIMRKSGLDPIPVFHHGENEKWLHKMLDAGATYIGIGGIAGRGTDDRRDWLDRIFTLLTDEEGKPLVKIHGLGVQSWEIMRRYPFHTCDATSWALQAAYGSIWMPRFRNSKPDYTCAPHVITLSKKGRNNGEIKSDHFQSLGPEMQRRVIDFLENHAGVEYEKAVEDYMYRAKAIVYFMLRVEDTLQDIRFTHRRQGFIKQYSGVRA